jgi:hypothetical protein
MPLIDYLKHFGAAAGKVLQPDERLIDLGLYHEPLVGDESRLIRTRDELSPRLRRHVDEHGPLPPRSDKFFQGFDLLRGGLQVNPDRINRFLGGVSGEGDAESLGGRWWRTAKSDQNRWDSLEYAVTDRRLLLLTDKSRGAGGTEYKILFELPRPTVASAARRGKLLFQRGRVEVHFTDRSMIAWSTGMLSTARARSLVAALSNPSAGTGEGRD